MNILRGTPGFIHLNFFMIGGLIACLIVYFIYRSALIITIMLIGVIGGGVLYLLSVYNHTGYPEGGLFWIIVLPAGFFSISNTKAGTLLSVFYLIATLLLEWSQKDLVVWTNVPDFVYSYCAVSIISFLFARLDEKSTEKLEMLSITDSLTGILNRRGFEKMMTAELSRSNRYERPASFLLFDIDHFKKINDKFGHQMGDRVLVELSKTVRSNIRLTDFFARWGGEEFVILTSETQMSSAKKMAQKLLALSRNLPFPAPGDLTVSIGLTTIRPGDTLDDIVKRADGAMYRAKKNGKNRLEIAK